MRSALKQQFVRHLGVANFGRARNWLYLVEVGRSLLGGENHCCNVCGYEGRFRAFGHPPRYGAQCPRCLSLERHRLFKSWIDNNVEQFSGKTVVHFAPERCIASTLATHASNYTAADLDRNLADTVLNLENIALPDQSVDVVVASHVLEHLDDRKALKELHRVLKPQGLAIIMVPIVEGWDRTYENDSVVESGDRAKHYGQWDHVRFYGRDFRDRVRAAGFSLAEFTATEPNVQKFGLSRGEKIFLGCKP